MPNYVKNILSFDGDPEQVDRLFSAILQCDIISGLAGPDS